MLWFEENETRRLCSLVCGPLAVGLPFRPSSLPSLWPVAVAPLACEPKDCDARKLSPLLLIPRVPSFLSTVSASTQDLRLGRRFEGMRWWNEFHCVFGKTGQVLKWKSLYFWEPAEMTLKIFGSSTCWKKVLLGEIISDTNEKASLDVAQKICHYFIEETHAVLRKVWF